MARPVEFLIGRPVDGGPVHVNWVSSLVFQRQGRGARFY